MDFVCPSCGSGLPEDTSKCPTCGLELDTVGEPDYECPDCGEMVPHDARDCPSCGAQFIMDEAEAEDVASSKAHGGAIDEMLEAAVKETIVTPKRDEAVVPTAEQPASRAVPPEAGTGDPGAASQWVEEVPSETGAEAGRVSAGVAPAEAAPAGSPTEGMVSEVAAGKASGTVAEAPKGPAEGKPLPKPAPPAMARAPGAPRRYAGGFTFLGMVFVILAGVALVLTIIALRWDAISTGSKYEAIGGMQSLIIMLGLAAFVFCAVASVYDLLRGAKRDSDKASAAVAPDLP